MLIKMNYWMLIYRGRRKKVVLLSITLLILLNLMVCVILELYSTISRRHKSVHVDGNFDVDEKGMRVIVGHYIGGHGRGNLSDEEIHTNNYSPVPGAGEQGKPVQLSPRELIKAQELYSLHSYNILAGDKIPINRTIRDMRSSYCKQIEYKLENLPSASVIIVFHNEAWSTLMRTVMSVLLRSPNVLLKEVILVDDASERRYLGKELEDAILKLDKVHLLRSPERKGLVGARLIGAKASQGDVLVFIDAHCEVTPGWLEPLLDRAGSDDVFICPQIDILSSDTLAYIKSINFYWGAFNWRLQFRWLMPSSDVLNKNTQDVTKSYATPAMAGGLFAVRKSLFWRLGGYDEGMFIWGGENLELSWRAWQCGARVEITSCSRVGHIFRNHSPYKYPGGVAEVLNTNLARAATVWMDEWADFFFRFNPAANYLRDKQTVGDRVDLRERLKCKSFKWYLDNVWPLHFFPTNDRWFGRIKNKRGSCIAANSSRPEPGIGASGVYCGEDNDLDKLVVYTPDGLIMTGEGLCLEQANGRAVWKSCSGTSNQVWLQKGPRLKTKEGECLTLVGSSLAAKRSGVGNPLTALPCLDSDTGQIWYFERVPWQ